MKKLFPGRIDINDLTAKLREQGFCESYAQVSVALLGVLTIHGSLLTFRNSSQSRMPMLRVMCRLRSSSPTLKNTTRSFVCSFRTWTRTKVSPSEPKQAKLVESGIFQFLVYVVANNTQHAASEVHISQCHCTSCIFTINFHCR